MDELNKKLSEAVGVVKSWLNWQSEPANVSKDFWMPDQSCIVCYECDSQFTLFNRRHHCRHCGRVFCATCTSNSVSTWSTTPNATLEERDKVRVCNYCFKQWEQHSLSPFENELHATGMDGSSTSISVASFLSTRSSITGGSSCIQYSVLPHSVGLSSDQSAVKESFADRQTVGGKCASNHSLDTRELIWCQHERAFLRCRSDDDDEDFEMPNFGSVASHFSQENGYFDHAQFDDTNNEFLLQVDHGEDAVDYSKSTGSSPPTSNFCCEISDGVRHMDREGSYTDNDDECEATSSLYMAAGIDTEPMDFENNGVLWLPPEQGGDEDDRESLSFELNDSNDAGELECLHSSRSSGSGEFQCKDKSIEEHNRDMKNVLDGHFQALLAQLLHVENLLAEEEDSKDSWLEIITALSWEAATMLKPDTSKGGQMDPVGYVKVKCVPSGFRSDSIVVKGVVCKKNVASKRMASKIERPRLLILGGALEYQRVSKAFSSIDTLLQQEMDHLKMAVAKLGAHNPDILLVEETVSRYAQEYLLAKNISLVLNVKRPILERISLCTGAQIVPSVDYLSAPELGYCDLFRVERVIEDHGAAAQAGNMLGRPLMFFEGCPKPLGVTVLLRGARLDELKKVKHVVLYGIFAAYHLALETCFLADEGASLPEVPLNSPITVALPEKLSAIRQSISSVTGFTIPTCEEAAGPVGLSPGASTSYLMKSLHPETIGSPCRKCFPNYSIKETLQHPFLEYEGHRWLTLPFGTNLQSHGATASHIFSDFVDRGAKNVHLGYCDSDDSKSELDLSSIQHDRDQAVADQPGGLKEEFLLSSEDNQSILVSLSSRCVWKGTICEKSHIFRIKYYGTNDEPLGRYLRDHLFDQNYRCNSCEMPAESHVQCYTHQQGALTISVKRLSEILLPGVREGKIWMWHRCLRCPRVNGFPPATRRIVMSDAAWGLSLGKFLELSFSNHAAASRAASCGHSLHRDCLRFYGFGQTVACFRYASVYVFSVYLPPFQLDFNFENKEWMENELNEVTRRAEILFSEVLNSLLRLDKEPGSAIFDGNCNSSDSRSQIMILEELLQDEKSKFEASLQNIMNVQPEMDILDLNQLRQQLILQSYIWDHRIRCAANLDGNDQDDTDNGNTETVLDIDQIKMGENSSSSVSEAADIKPQLLRANHASGICHDIFHGVGDVHVNQFPLVVSTLMKDENESDPLLSGIKVRRALSEGQAPICLSDTLDTVWTVDNQPSAVHVPYSTSNVVEPNTSEMEDSKEDLIFHKMIQSPSSVSSKSGDNFDEPISWLGTSFSSFYRPYKNILGTRHKLDTISKYDPVFISAYRESEPQGVGCFLLPVGVNEIVIPVYEDEPTSIISYALMSPDYISQVSDELDRSKDPLEFISSVQSPETQAFHSFHSSDEKMLESYKSLGSVDESVTSSFSTHTSLPSEPLPYVRTSDATVCFAVYGPLGKVNYTCTCYYAKCFKLLREMCCPSEVNYVRSLSRCRKWGAQGGKSNVFFAKTLDDRLIIKQVTKTELESFIKFAPSYFKYVTESISTKSPTCLAKILGIYQVASKHANGGKETRMDLLVMENLLFRRNVTRLYDLKGSCRSRYNPDSSGKNKVLLDQNLIESMPTSPIFVGNKSKRFLERAIWNDTAFLASIDVMDYSLLVGLDQGKHELVLGIIDFMRQYTWDKHLETWVKASGILGGVKNTPPTVISPKQYKRRFRKAMSTYFLMVPDQWAALSALVPSPATSEMIDNSHDLQSTTSAD